MKSEIKLESRGNLENILVQTENNPLRYKLRSEFCCRMGLNKDKPSEANFLDPAGGPFMTVGDIIDGHKIKAIYTDCTIEFEE